MYSSELYPPPPPTDPSYAPVVVGRLVPVGFVRISSPPLSLSSLPRAMEATVRFVLVNCALLKI
jgi:hypothetical protein